MAPEITSIEHPIDVMYLIHKAIRAEARRTRQAAEQLEMGGNFKPFTQVFYRWAMALEYHEDTEYKYLIPFLPTSLPARHNEVGHRELLHGLEELQICLQEELRRTIVIPRTQRQLFGKVIALLIAQADLLEDEEATLLPAIRAHISADQQLKMAERLLFDSEGDDACWMLDWMVEHLTASERQALARFMTRFTDLPHTLPSALSDDLALSHETSLTLSENDTAMTPAVLPYEHPIDVMYLIHKALSTEAWHTETLTEGLQEGESLQPFVQAFDRWVTALGFHADMEDAYMTPLLPASATTRDNEAAHARLGQRVDTIRAYVQQLDDTVVTTRIRRHLFGKVVALRIDQDDHLEEEEAFVLPIIRERMLQAEQIDIAQRLLVDPQAQDTGWVLDWLVQDLTDTDRQALAALSTHFQPTLSRPEVTT